MNRKFLYLLIISSLITTCVNKNKIISIPDLNKDAFYINNYKRFIDVPFHQSEKLDDIILFYQSLPDTVFPDQFPDEGIISCKVLIDTTGDVKDILLLSRTNSQFDKLILKTIQKSKFKKLKDKRGKNKQYLILISYPFCERKLRTPLLNGVPITLLPKDSLDYCNDKVSSNFEKPEILNMVVPAYPDRARKAGIQGRVLVDIVVNKQGFVEYSKAINPKSTILENVAVDAAMLFRLKPAVQRARKVKVRMRVPIDFALNM